MSWLTWSLLSALFAAATAILAKVGVRQMDSNLATAIRATVVWLFTWALVLTLGRHPDGIRAAISRVPSRDWLFLTLSGIATGLSWLCYFRALQPGEVSRVPLTSSAWCW